MKKGVSLIELLTAIGILSLLILILFFVFSAALRGWKKADNLLQTTEIARTVLERMSREIASAMIIPGNNEFYCLGFDESSPSGYRTNNQGDEFYFIAPLKTGNTDGSDLCEVGYWLDDQATAQNNDDILRRFYVTDDRKVDATGPEFDFDFSTGRSYELATNISQLRFFYYDSEGNEYTSWDSRTSGQALKKIMVIITVEVGEGTPATNPDYFINDFSKIIHLP